MSLGCTQCVSLIYSYIHTLWCPLSITAVISADLPILSFNRKKKFNEWIIQFEAWRSSLTAPFPAVYVLLPSRRHVYHLSFNPKDWRHHIVAQKFFSISGLKQTQNIQLLCYRLRVQQKLVNVIYSNMPSTWLIINNCNFAFVWVCNLVAHI